MEPVALLPFFKELGGRNSLVASLFGDIAPAVFILLLVFILLIGWMVWKRPFSSSNNAGKSDRMPDTTTVTPRPFLTKGEATLLNLIRLAVQDSYLVFAKIPVSSLVTITEEDPEARRTLMRTIQSARLDVALIHPGTLRPALAIKFVEDQEPAPQPDERDQLIGAVLQAAGINVVRVELYTAYTVGQLAEMFGLGEPD